MRKVINIRIQIHCIDFIIANNQLLPIMSVLNSTINRYYYVYN